MARRSHAMDKSRISCLEQRGGGRIRTNWGQAGFARTIGESVFTTNLCLIGGGPDGPATNVVVSSGITNERLLWT